MAEIDKTQSPTILDVGIGFGVWGYLTHVLRKPSLLVGIDINLDYLLASRRHNVYNDLVLASASFLPFREDVFDYVLAIEVIEHLPKGEAEKTFTELEHVCRSRIVLTTPNGFLEQHPCVAPESEVHRSSWSAQELTRMGYKVRGIGLKGTSKLRSRANLTVYGLLNYLSTLITFFFPKFSEYLLSVKNVSGKSR